MLLQAVEGEWGIVYIVCMERRGVVVIHTIWYLCDFVGREGKDRLGTFLLCVFV